MRRFLFGALAGAALMLCLVVVVAWRIVDVGRRQDAAIRNAYRAFVLHTGGVWNRLAPATRSWIVSRPWHDGLYRCTIDGVDLDTGGLSLTCGDVRLGFNFQFQCDHGAVSNALRFVRLAECVEAPNLSTIRLKAPRSEWQLLFVDGEPLVN